MSFLNWIRERGKRDAAESPSVSHLLNPVLPHRVSQPAEADVTPSFSPSPSRSYSLRSDLRRILKTEADVKIDDALVAMRVVVDEISKNPSANWREYRDDFEKAVEDVREAFGSKAPRRNEPENEQPPSRYSTRKGNEIAFEKASEWISDGVGMYELRRHVGKSLEGYHGGLEISRQGGDSSWNWSNARPTMEAAEKAAHGMHRAWERKMGPELDRIEALQHKHSESPAARDRGPDMGR